MKITGIETLPNFFLIGAAKSGTTALFDILGQHQQVFIPFIKELKFFNNDTNYSKGIDWYNNTYFKNAGEIPLRGEATPHYLYWGEKVSTRIKLTYGQAELKFIAIFRDPVSRAYSQYWMEKKGGKEWLPFNDALAAEEQRLIEMHKELEPNGLLKYAYFHGGCYATLLQPFLKHFPREQFHFILQDDLQTNFSFTMKNLTEFLGIQTDFGFQQVISNPSYVPRSHRLNNILLYRSEPFQRIIRVISHLIPESYRYRFRNKLIQANRRPQSNPPMNPEVEYDLRLRFKDEIKKLEVIIDRDLSLWLKEVCS